LFLVESKSDIAQKLEDLANNGKVLLVISDWVINECMAVIERKIIEKRITNNEAFHILNAITNLPEEKLKQDQMELYSIEGKHIIASGVIIQDINLINASDALHIFIALLSECNAILSADVFLTNALKKKIKVLNFTPINFNNEREVKKLFKLLEKN
jgi:predicted nucleic acid-binding protein